jgi:putative hydrolase of the HAD superfamily
MKAILFDFGGTLDTNGVHWSEYFWDAYQHVHIPIDKSVYEQAYVAAERVLPGDRIRRSDGFAATIRAQVHAQFEYLAAHGFPFDPTAPEDVARICFTGAQTTAAEHLPLLEKLSQRYALAAVSNF